MLPETNPIGSKGGKPIGNWQNIRIVLAGNHADPSVMRDGQDYYLTNSTNNYNPSLEVWHSRDLIHWESLGYALSKPDGSIWAPDITKVGDTFYIYYPSDGAIHVVTAKNPAGPWSSPVDLKLPHEWIDPGHVVGPDGKRYLGLSKGYLVQLSDDGLSIVGQPRKIYDGWPVPWDPNRFVGEGQCLEGPKFFRHGGYYYFVSAENGTAGPPTSHMLVVARATTLEGPWENCPYNPIVHTESRNEPWWSRGHGTIFDTADGRWYVIYHAYKADFLTLGRFTLIQPIKWTDDGWPEISEATDADDPVLATAAPSPRKFVDTFNRSQLNAEWQYYGFKTPAMKLDQGLIMQGKGEDIQHGSFVTFIASDTSYSIETEVELSSGAPKAGMLFFYSPEHYAGLMLESDGLHFERDITQFPIANTRVRRIGLRMVNEHNVITMYYRRDTDNWQRIDFAYDLSGYNHNTFGGYDSLRPALSVSGSGSAIFHNFSYRSADASSQRQATN